MNDKSYHYRPGPNDDWEVYSLQDDADGESIEEWKAYVETEAIAITLVFAMSHSTEVRILMNRVIHNEWVDGLTVGSKLISIHGATSDTEDGEGVYIGPDAVGTIIAHLPNNQSEFSVLFDKGVTGFISKEELRDTSQYQSIS